MAFTYDSIGTGWKEHDIRAAKPSSKLLADFPPYQVMERIESGMRYGVSPSEARLMEDGIKARMEKQVRELLKDFPSCADCSAMKCTTRTETDVRGDAIHFFMRVQCGMPSGPPCKSGEKVMRRTSAFDALAEIRPEHRHSDFEPALVKSKVHLPPVSSDLPATADDAW